MREGDDGSLFVGNHGVHPLIAEALAAVQERQLDEEPQRHDLAATARDQR